MYLHSYSHSRCAGRLWTAPELLRQEKYPPDGTLKADVYSFAIICQEIIFREGVFYIRGLEDLLAGMASLDRYICTVQHEL